MAEPIFVNQVVVPAEALEMRAVRASGPGGQNVNKVASKVEIRVDLDRIRGMDPDSRARLVQIVHKRLDSSGRLVVTSQRTRDQHRNIQDARLKIGNWIAKALTPPQKRVGTRPTQGSRRKRLEKKRRQSMLKQNRRGPSDEY
jgi:ribosome-associated protein